MIRYVFKDDPVPIKNKAKADPQKIGESLGKIAAAAKGHLTPKAVIEVARDSRHILHKHFEWDDAVAAEAFRLDQARCLIRAIHLVDEGKEEQPQAFISIAEKGGVSYRTHAEVMDSAELQLIVLKQAERDFEAYERRLNSFRDLCDEIRRVRDKISTKRTNIESRAQA